MLRRILVIIQASVLAGMVYVSMCEASGLKAYNCPKVASAPVIDGRLDDKAWAEARPVKFVRNETGGSIAEKTVARMCWDDDNLYIAFGCEDRDIFATYTKHDDHLYTQDVVEIFINPSEDLVHYYELEVSPRNVTFDASIVNKDALGPFTSDLDWTCEGMHTAVVVDGTLDDRTDVDKRWTVEIAVPFKSLGRETPKPGEQWRLNLYRINHTGAMGELYAWCPTLCGSYHQPKRFGTVTFRAGK